MSIRNKSTGYSYERIFGVCLKEEVTKVQIDEPFLQHDQQVVHFIITASQSVTRVN